MFKLIDIVISFTYKNRVLTLFGALLLVIIGFYSLQTLDTEAYPEFTPPQVKVITVLPGKGAEEVERLITIPLEKEMNGIPGETSLRSISLFGLSVLTITFDDSTQMALDRQRILERISQADIPNGVQPQMGPEQGAVSEIYRYTLESKYWSAMDRKSIEAWQLERAFRAIPGVIDVSTFGGPTKTYQVNVDPKRLLALNLSLPQVFQALSNSNASTGGNYIEHNGQAYVVRGIGLLKNISDIQDVVVSSTQNGTPIRVGDVATVNIGAGVRLGQFGKNGDDDDVMGIILMRRGENPERVIEKVYEQLPEIQRQLPKGMHLVPLYDRNNLMQETLHTIGHNVLEGIGLVLVVLIIFLGDVTCGLITATVIPLALLFAFFCLKMCGIPANLLSLGAIDFGIIVDGAVVIVENAFTMLSTVPRVDNPVQDKQNRLDVVLQSSKMMGKPMLFATVVIIMAFAPIFAFNGVAGKLFHPLAFTMIFALVGAVLLSLTFIPVLISIFMTRPRKVKPGHPAGEHAESWVIRKAHRLYRPTLAWALRNPILVVGSAILAFTAAMVIFMNTGSEFLPPLEEGNIWLRATVIPTSASLEESVHIAHQIRAIVMKYPEVKNVTSQNGSPDDGTDPNLFSNIECLVDLYPASQWRGRFHGNKEELVASMNKDLSVLPNVLFNFSQYIQDNVDEAISGAKGNVGIKIYGPDLYVLQKLGDQITQIVTHVPGMVDVADTKQVGQPQYQITIDRAEADRYGINTSDIQDLVETAVGGKVATQVIEGEKRFNLLVRLGKSYRNSEQALEALTIDPPGPIGPTPLAQFAHIEATNGATMINRESNSRLMIIKANVRGRDLGSAVREAQQKVEKQVKIPDGYQITWGGQYEYQQQSNQRMMLVIPIALVLIFLVLLFTFGSVSNALLVLSAVPLAVIGGIFALFITHTYFSVSAGVGFIALFGVAVQNGIIQVSYINQLRHFDHMPIRDAVFEGALMRMRPVLMTASVAILGLLPAALSNGIGSQSQKPFAIVIIGGLMSATFLTLLVLPTLYNLIEKDREPPEHEILYDDPIVAVPL